MRPRPSKGNAFRSAAIAMLVLLLPASGAFATQYYVSYFELYRDGIIADSGLSMAPAPEEYRVEDFRPLTAEGEAAWNPKVPLEEATRHNAISGLLLKRGLTSIASGRLLSDTAYRDAILIRYEGVVKLPCREIEVGYVPGGKLRGTYEIDFSPTAPPESWRALALRKKLKDFAAAAVGLFRP